MKAISLPFKIKNPILACGADLKGAFALATDREAFLADGFGDLADIDNFSKYKKAIRSALRHFSIEPAIIACDLHPSYHSTGFAEDFSSRRDCAPIKVQHHEAHIASVLVDNCIKGGCIGVAFDGTGYGSDGNIWGGEFFVGGLKNFKRAAHFEYVKMPGGEAAIREPWRMAASYLRHAFGKKLPDPAKRWRRKDLSILNTMMEKSVNSPLTSSVGRLFDAVGNLVLSQDRVSKEAELPMELEKILTGQDCEGYRFRLRPESGIFMIDTIPVIKGIIKDITALADRALISCKFHNAVTDIILETSIKLRKNFKLKKVVLSGGVFQNRYLTGRTVKLLRQAGFEVYAHTNIPTSDSGIPIGQIAIANARMSCA